MTNISALVVVAAAFFSCASAACFGACGIGPGEDMCRKKCVPLVVRPQELPKPPAPTILVPQPPKPVPIGALPPIGGPCYCKVPLVKPAVLPKPACAIRKKTIVTSGCSATNHHVVETVSGAGAGFFGGGCAAASPYGGGYAVGSPYVGGAPAYGAPAYGAPAVVAAEQLAPADAVSMQIAYNQAQKALNLKEDVLAFGFRQLPKEMPPMIRRSNNIREENLYSLNGAVVELKPVAASGKSLDEEAAEQLLDLQTEQDELVAERGVRRLALGEIGYGPAKAGQKPLYAPVPSLVEPPALCANPGGYLPGTVLFTDAPKGETVQLPAPLPEPCPEEPSCHDFLRHYSSSHSSNSGFHYKKTCGCRF